MDDRFMAMVSKQSDGCWIWIGAKLKSGYGHMTRHGRHQLAHRFCYEYLNGPQPRWLYVCHSCDVPSCVNPAHLWLGTPKENTRDASRKGRLEPHRHAVGEAHGLAKLTSESVLEMRRLHDAGVSERKLAAIFGVVRSTAHSAVSRETWR